MCSYIDTHILIKQKESYSFPEFTAFKLKAARMSLKVDGHMLWFRVPNTLKAMHPTLWNTIKHSQAERVILSSVSNLTIVFTIPS